jgi:hypothetical protein
MINQSKNTEHNSGQVLILAIIMLVILLLAAMFLFDLHNIIRSKIKLETAEQAAAMTAAKWQKESLNLIGEINLVKACDTLLLGYGTPSDVPEENPEATYISGAKALTEMQTRISFVGPLIGYGAANQAAKYNGVDIKDSDGAKTVLADMNEIMTNLSDPDDIRYGAIAGTINNYQWRTPYIQMLNSLKTQGLAVRPSGRFPGLEGVTPSWLAWEDLYSSIYQATTMDYWCPLASILRLPDSFWNSKWWQIAYQKTSFPQESEIYTLGLEYTPGIAVDRLTADPYVKQIASGVMNVDNWTSLPEAIKWCIYDSRWVEGNANYSGPDTAYWNGNSYLRKNLKKSFLYGGAVAYAECYQRISTVSKYKSAMKTPGKTLADQQAKAKAAFTYTVDGEEKPLLVETSVAQIKVGNDSKTDNEPGGVVAKPIGALPDGNPPTSALMVLPVFTDVAIIPSQMQDYRPMRATPTKLDDFLEWLANVKDLNNPSTSPPEGTEYYLAALQKLNDPYFRKSGYNSSYSGSVADDADYFNEGYKYSPSNPSGAGRLQQVWLEIDNSKFDYFLDKGTVIEDTTSETNFTRYYLGNRFFRRRKSDGKLMNYESSRCFPREGDYRYTTGPSRL